MEPIIQVEHLCKSFEAKGGTVEAARDICFSIEKGDIFGIIGLSGAGKSTLVRCLNLWNVLLPERCAYMERILQSFQRRI